MWHQVILTPDDNKIIVFKRGVFIGLYLSRKKGGHCWPKVISGEREKWKNPQKKDKKKKISDKINNIIPILIPLFTKKWWNPCKFSRVTSFHQQKEIISTIIK